jgi:xanthine dehydrogenase molybdopterin-binding subunit B
MTAGTGVIMCILYSRHSGHPARHRPIDPATGETRIADYVVVDDFGVTFDPLLLAGQVHGGTAQGIGQALMERTVYDSD